MSFHIEMHHASLKTRRTTYDLLKFIRDIGGVSVGLLRIFSLIVGYFSAIRLESILTGRLFFLSERTKED